MPHLNFRTWLGWAPALAVALIAPAAAQESPPDAGERTETEASQVVEEVVVRGRRLSEIKSDLNIYINNFLEEVAAPARTRGYARWHRQVCIGVHNLENGAAQYIADRISDVAREVGLEPGEPGCQANVNVIFATDAREMAAHMVEDEPYLFRPGGGLAGMDLGLEALDDFVKSDRPVRWWHVSLPVDARTGAPAIELPQTRLCGSPRCPPQLSVAGPSRLHSGTRDDLQYVVIIVDATRLPGTTWQQIADYLAVVSLAQVDPTANPEAFDSILNLFSHSVYSGLTDWDWSYLRALYEFDQERVPQAQRNEIINRIAQQEMATAQ